jgi:hypothetical protein
MLALGCAFKKDGLSDFCEISDKIANERKATQAISSPQPSPSPDPDLRKLLDVGPHRGSSGRALHP